MFGSSSRCGPRTNGLTSESSESTSRQKAMKGYTKHDKDLFESLAGKSLKTR